MLNFGEKEEKNNKTEKQEDNLGKTLRNKIVINDEYLFYFLGRKYDRSNCWICIKKLYWKNFFLFKVSNK